MFEFIPILACDPMVLMAASMAMSAAGAASQHASSKQQAQATADMQRRVGKQRVAQSVLNASDVRARQGEEQAATHRTKEDIDRRTQVASSRARVSAGENGIGGGGLDALLLEFEQREAELFSSANLQLDSATLHIDRELERMRQSAEAGLVSTFRPINQPSVGAAALQFGGEALKSYSTYTQGGYGDISRPPSKRDQMYPVDSKNYVSGVS